MLTEVQLKKFFFFLKKRKNKKKAGQEGFVELQKGHRSLCVLREGT